jgi:hypothetical protein
MSKTQQNNIKLNENSHFFNGTDDYINNEIEPFTIFDYPLQKRYVPAGTFAS